MDNRHITQSFTHSLEDYEMQEDTPSSALATLSSESYVSKDLLKSATIENLISQNEDLMARQRVTLRRLATLEDLNQELQSENFQQKNQILNYSDQVQVMKEKDAAWKAKVDELENERDKLAKVASEFEKAQTEMERHRKYHDKIKFQVKPYIQSLKRDRDSALAQLENFKNHIHLKESQLKEMRNQMQEVLRQSKNQVDDIQRQKQGLVEHFENQIQQLKEDKALFEKAYNEMKEKLSFQNQALENQAELENRVIELERSKLDLRANTEKEILRLQQKVNDLDGYRTRLEIENQDMKEHIQGDHATRLRLEEELIQLRRQMESLRFMWNQKNEECERQSKTLEALENLNNSLSQKIQELRTAAE